MINKEIAPGNNLTDRDGFIDFIKGISIILVLWGHCIQYFSIGKFDFYEDYMFKTIYSFHMPLFMLLSGYVSYWGNNRKLDIILLKRIKGIGVPLIIWGTFDFVLSILRTKNLSLTQIVNVQNWVQSITGVWFLWAVLCASFCMAVIHKLPVDIYIKYVIAFMAIFVFLLLPEGTLAAYMYPYFVIEYAINEFGIFQNSIYIKVVQPICAVLWCVLLRFYQKRHYIYVSGLLGKIEECGLKGQISIDIYRYIIGLVGSVTIIAIARWGFDFLQGKGEKIEFLQMLGQYTLEIYLMQRILLEFWIAGLYQIAVAYIGENVLAINRLIYDWLFTLPCAMLLGILLLKMANAISRCPQINRFLFGKSSRVK